MVLISRFHKKCRIAYLQVMIAALFLAILFMPSFEPVRKVGDNIFTIVINGNAMGRVASESDADRVLCAARRQVAGSEPTIMLIDADIDIVGEDVFFGRITSDSVLVSNIIEEFEKSVTETMSHSYTVKIDNYMVNLSTAENVVELLEASIHRYDTEEHFSAGLTVDSTRELPVLIPKVIDNRKEADDGKYASDYLSSEGFYGDFDAVINGVNPDISKNFDDFDYGIVNVSFANNVDVIESYLPKSQITDIETAIEQVTKDTEQKTIYEVVSGDTLSGIAEKVGITIDDLISLNENITGPNSIIRVGDEIVVTVPKPELSVRREELVYYEGTYEAPIEYVYNDNWYTTTEVTLQDPSSGYHKAVQKITYIDSEVIDTEVVMEEVVAEAVPKIVEKGTKIPPTYIKPLSGGRLTSGFGRRTSTIRGMTSYHLGVDWGTPVGTSVWASCGGQVTHAGWMSGYGYCIFINHPDGKQTRYAHLSRILVRSGQYVSQGEKIALSGNSGVSTGPHLHFEIRINGKAVNPLNYLN